MSVLLVFNKNKITNHERFSTDFMEFGHCLTEPLIEFHFNSKHNLYGYD